MRNQRTFNLGVNIPTDEELDKIEDAPEGAPDNFEG